MTKKQSNKLYYCIFTLCIVSCTFNKPFIVQKNVEGTILIKYEKSGDNGDEAYYQTAKKIVLNDIEYDLLERVDESSQLDKILKKCKNYRDTAVYEFAYIKSEDKSHYYSDYIYHLLADEDEITIIFNFKGDAIKVRKLPKDEKYGLYNNYSCPVVLDILNAPFYKIIRVDSFYETHQNWIRKNYYYKGGIKHFIPYFCD